MALWQGKSKRKSSGGKYWPFRKKRAREIGKDPVYAKLSETEIKKPLKKRASRKTTKAITLVGANQANINIKGKSKKVKILAVRENAANRHFVRRNVITKGAVIDTEAGLAKVTSRPTRDGVVNAILIKEK